METSAFIYNFLRQLEKDGYLSDEEFSKFDLKLRLHDEFCSLTHAFVVKKILNERIATLIATIYQEVTSKNIKEKYLLNKWQGDIPIFQ
jgi:hypothetical protein